MIITSNILEGYLPLFKSTSINPDMPELSGVYINFYEGLMCATNRKILVTKTFICPSELRQYNAVILPPQIYHTFKDDKHFSGYSLGWDHDKIHIMCYENEFIFKFIENKYPDFKKAIPAPGREESKISLNPKLLLQLAESMSLPSSSGLTLGISMDAEGNKSPIQVSTDGCTRGYIMPMDL